jgi:hypothetical protein
MKPRVTLRKALEDPELLGSALAGPSWHAWRSLLLATMGEPLTPDELETFTRFTGRATPPSQRVDELWCCVGRRGGKSRAMAVLAVYLAGLCDYKHKLAAGETGTVLLIAPDKKQAKVPARLCRGDAGIHADPQAIDCLPNCRDVDPDHRH